MSDERPIGVFDSGIGGLSVLRALLDELPQERFVYVADSGHAPYGERDDAHVLARAHTIAEQLVREHGIKALVVACNTATAAAIVQLRAAHPDLPIVGIEPALKPAALRSQTKQVAVMATRSTLNSRKFADLLGALHGQAIFYLQPCDGLADAVDHDDGQKILNSCSEHLGALGPFGNVPGAIDTLVLGCTHYPLVSDVIRNIVGPEITLLEAGEPVARRTKALLEKADLLSTDRSTQLAPLFFSTGDTGILNVATMRWLAIQANARPF